MFVSWGFINTITIKKYLFTIYYSAAQCGLKKSVRVIGGQNTQINEYPWMALLRHKGQHSSGHLCGGTMINSRWILTATHCLDDDVITKGGGQRDAIMLQSQIILN